VSRTTLLFKETPGARVMEEWPDREVASEGVGRKCGYDGEGRVVSFSSCTRFFPFFGPCEPLSDVAAPALVAGVAVEVTVCEG
jgi:hypothetical protein